MLRLALAQFRPSKGAWADTLADAGRVFREAAALPAPPDVIFFPESAFSGYFLEGGVRDVARSASALFDELTAVHAAAGVPPVDIVAGFYETWRNRIHNSALYATLGGADAGVRHVHRKVFLPTYGVFDEERFVEAGREVQAFDTSWGRAAMLVCEDAWHSLMPTIAALDGAQVIFVPSATPARGLTPRPGDDDGSPRPANLDRWERLATAAAAEHGCFVAVSQLVGFEGGKGFLGGSLVAAPDGELLAQAGVFEPELLLVELDLGAITRARADAPFLADLEIKLPHLLESLGSDRRTGDFTEVERPQRRPEAVRPGILHAARRDPLAIDPALARRWLVEFIRDEVRRRRGFEKVVLGLSGGVDSALVAYLAAEALGPKNVVAVRMPYRTSSPDSLAHAQLVIDDLGLEHRTVDITGPVNALIAAVGSESPARKGNVMARTRMIVLFDLSSALHALPIGTGNKTERLMGYFTWHADDSPPVNPLGDLFKTQVWALARHVGVPGAIIDKPASADLIHGQTDEGDFGVKYGTADRVLHWLLSGYSPAEVAQLGIPAPEVELVRSRLEGTHWKRRLPTVAMVSQTAIGEYYLRPVDY
jgi:NAD+ synthetase